MRHQSVDTVTSNAEVAALYAAYGRRLLTALMAAGATPMQAEDLLQEAFARLLPRWASVRRYDSPEAWLRTVAFRLYLSEGRRSRLFLRRAPLLRQPDQVAGPTPDRVATADAMAQLSPAHRAVVVLHYLLDMPVEQVAETLAIPIGTVKSRLSRAREQLATLMEVESSDGT